jgi:hypothetical protein
MALRKPADRYRRRPTVINSTPYNNTYPIDLCLYLSASVHLWFSLQGESFYSLDHEVGGMRMNVGKREPAFKLAGENLTLSRLDAKAFF